MVTDNADVGKPAEENADAALVEADDRRDERSGLPGRPMALLIAVALALASAGLAWLVAGGYRALFG